MSKRLDAALQGAVAAVARRSDIPLSPTAVEPVAEAIAAQMPAPLALEALWPQLLRYAISIAGTALAARGIGDAATWQAIAGGAVALAPPVYRVITTLIARRVA